MWRLLIISVLFSVCVAQILDGTFQYRSVIICDEEHEFDKRCSDDCHTIEFCRINSTSPDTYSWQFYRKCQDGEICDESTLKCSKTEETRKCIEKTGKISCNETGVYPHPHYCNKFIYCDAEEKDNTVYSCPPTFMFSACTKSCDWKYSEADCSLTDIDCTGNLGEKHEVYTNNRIYYKCDYESESETFFPVFYNCPKGLSFTNGACNDHPSPGCGIE